MQEVTVKPRSSFRHFVTVDAGRHRFDLAPPTGNNAGRRHAAADATARVGRRAARRAQPGVVPRAARQRPQARADESGHRPGRSGGGMRRPRSCSRTSTPTKLVELIPIAHYDSAKLTVKGTYRVTDPGVYVLVFDNSFSNGGSRSGVSAVISPLLSSPLVTDNNNSSGSARVEGWILKKGDRKIQGYLKRWLVIDSRTGNLEYFKTVGGQPRAVVALSSAAVRLDHDNLLIDIDSGSAILHMKAINQQDFQMWVGALQSHTHTAKLSPFERNGSGVSSFSVDSSQYGGGAVFSGGTTPSAGPIDSATQLAELQKQMEDTLSTLWAKGHPSASVTITSTLPTLANDLAKAVLSSQTAFTLYNQSVQSTITTLSVSQIKTDAAFKYCLSDNNKLRTQYSLPQASESSFRAMALSKNGGSISLGATDHATSDSR
ncbi:Pleckstrin homology domain-containing protein [Obelidium mucronatum]|nr:Pleckstrin homology domain-containing protein [Obelidium mucronatum]